VTHVDFCLALASWPPLEDDAWRRLADIEAMRIRNKLLVAMAVPAGLLVAQIVSVNFFVRQLQSAVSFISSAHEVIEADFDAVEIIGKLRDEVKQLPSGWVAEQSMPEAANQALDASRSRLTSLIDFIKASKAAQEIEPTVLEDECRPLSKQQRN
jgi:hypothetical protein